MSDKEIKRLGVDISAVLDGLNKHISSQLIRNKEQDGFNNALLAVLTKEGIINVPQKREKCGACEVWMMGLGGNVYACENPVCVDRGVKKEINREEKVDV